MSLSSSSLTKRKLFQRTALYEWVVERLIFLTGGLSITLIVFIFAFLLRDSLPFVTKYGHSLTELAFGREWYPNSEKFGAASMLYGTFMVTLIATVIAVPLGIVAALYIGAVAPVRVREILKPTIELIAAIPSVVVGFIGIQLVAPFIYNFSVNNNDIFQMNSTKSAMAAGLMLAFMALPTIVSVAEDAIRAVPKDYSEGALALGATRWETLMQVVFPAASSGIIAAVMLGIGRAIGETMTVLLVAGNAAVISSGWTQAFQPVRTMTATIAMETGEAPVGGEHYSALFMIGLMLFVITFIVNFTADWFVRRRKVKA